MNMRNCFTITRFTLLEVRRARLWWFVIGLVVVGCLIGEFGASIAITESAAHRVVFYAASMRLIATFIIAVMVATSVRRDIDDNVVALILSRPVSRSEWYLGKFIGYFVALTLFSALTGLPLILQSYFAGLVWSYSLMLELAIVAAATLAFALTLKHITVALSAVAGFYLLSRAIAALGLMSRGPTVDISLTSNRFVAWFIDGLSHVLPDLDRFTRTQWLVNDPPNISEISLLTVQALVYVGLLLVVGLFDVYRRNF